MKTVRRLIPLLLLPLLAGCNQGMSMPVERTLFQMDTYVTLCAYGEQAETALSACTAELARLEALFSVTQAESDIAHINAADGASVAIDTDTLELLAAAKALSAETGGAFDATVYPLMQLWGFGGEPSVPDGDDIAALLPLVDMEQLVLEDGHASLPAGMGLDLGGIAKGYAADKLCALLGTYGVKSAMLSLGGNVSVIGTKPDGSNWRIGIRNPKDASGIVGVVEASDCAIVTSGSYQRYFEADGKRYHHILDPDTGYPADGGLASVTIMTANGTRADALSTALFVMGEADAIRYWRVYGQGAEGFACVLVTEDGRVLYTEGAPFSPASGVHAECIPLQAS